MKFDTQHFQKIEDAKDELTAQLGLDSSFMEDISDEVDGTVEVVQSPEHIIVACLKYDDSGSSEFFEDGDSNGELTVFRSSTEYNQIMDKLEKEGSLFYLVDRYQHGNVHYSVSGSQSYPDAQWDLSGGCGVFIPCEDIQEQYQTMKESVGTMAAFEHFTQDSNNVLNDYSNWCNGEIYGYQIYVYNKDGELVEEDNSYGMIGQEQASSEMQNALYSHYEKSLLEQTLKDIKIETFTHPKDVPAVDFKWDMDQVQEIKFAHVYDCYTLAVKYQQEDRATVYHYSQTTEQLTEASFELWQKRHGVSAETFLNARMKSDIKDVLREHLNDKEAHPKP